MRSDPSATLQVTDVLLGMLRTMKALKHLHLGHVRLTRERLEDLWTDGKSKLEELTVHGVEITAGSLLALGEYSSLKALGMTACYQVSNPDLFCTVGRGSQQWGSMSCFKPDLLSFINMTST